MPPRAPARYWPERARKRRSGRLLSTLELSEVRPLLLIEELDVPDGAVAVLLHEHLRPVRLLLGLGLLLLHVVLVAVEQDDDVGILLDGSRFPQVGHARPVIGPVLDVPVEL